MQPAKYPAAEALKVIDGPLVAELKIFRLDDRNRSKAQVFALGGPQGKQFALVLGNTDVETGEHPAQQTRVLLERCNPPPLTGVTVMDEFYQGSRIKSQQDSRLAAPNQVSCLVENETALVRLLNWYAGRESDGHIDLAPKLLGMEATKVEKAAVDAGFDLTPVHDRGRLIFRSTTFPYSLGVSLVGESHYEVGFSDAAWGEKVATDCAFQIKLQPGEWPAVIKHLAGYASLYEVLQRAGAIGRVHGKQPLAEFKATTQKMPSSTEAERLVVQRVGQDIFRKSLIDYWQGRCAVTGLSVVPLLRASHIKPWSECETDAERLDVYNGLLLAPHLDALFDGGWISFLGNGEMVVSGQLAEPERALLGLRPDMHIAGLTDAHLEYLHFHRVKHGFSEKGQLR